MLRPVQNERGQAMIEFGLVVTMFVTLTIGIVEFGRAFMVANVITHAAREGARAAAVTIDRDVNGFLNGSARTNITTQIKSEINVVMDATTNITGSCGTGTCANGVCFDQQPPGAVGTSIPTVKVTVCGSVPLIFNYIGSSLTVARAATFRDEGR